jgi:hypothetical protein
MRSPAVWIAAALLGALAGCGRDDPASPRKATLSRGSTLSVSTTTEGRVEIVVTVPPGAEGAGTYRSTDAALADSAREAKSSLNEPGVAVRVTVDGDRIVALEHSRTR